MIYSLFLLLFSIPFLGILLPYLISASNTIMVAVGVLLAIGYFMHIIYIAPYMYNKIKEGVQLWVRKFQ